MAEIRARESIQVKASNLPDALHLQSEIAVIVRNLA
jgi:hypothetical protein